MFASSNERRCVIIVNLQCILQLNMSELCETGSLLSESTQQTVSRILVQVICLLSNVCLSIISMYFGALGPTIYVYNVHKYVRFFFASSSLTIYMNSLYRYFRVCKFWSLSSFCGLVNVKYMRTDKTRGN